MQEAEANARRPIRAAGGARESGTGTGEGVVASPSEGLVSFGAKPGMEVVSVTVDTQSPYEVRRN